MKKVLTVLFALIVGAIIGWIGGTIESNKLIKDACNYYNRYTAKEQQIDTEFFYDMIDKSIDNPLP